MQHILSQYPPFTIFFPIIFAGIASHSHGQARGIPWHPGACKLPGSASSFSNGFRAAGVGWQRSVVKVELTDVAWTGSGEKGLF